jgi:hypothetical protein
MELSVRACLIWRRDGFGFSIKCDVIEKWYHRGEARARKGRVFHGYNMLCHRKGEWILDVRNERMTGRGV